MHTADRFCDLAGFHPDRLEPVVYAHDGSCCTLIEVDGTRTIISDAEFEEASILRIAASLTVPATIPWRSSTKVCLQSGSVLSGELMACESWVATAMIVSP